MGKQITLLIKQMVGGGAERVISLLSNSFAERGYDTTLIITHQSLKDADLTNIQKNVHTISLEDEVTRESKKLKSVLMLKARFVGKINRTVLRKSDDEYLIKKYEVRNFDKVHWLKKYFEKNAPNTIIAFLNDSIFLALLSAQKSDRVIISERSDPRQSVSTKTNMAFFKTMYDKANQIVFQSPDVMQWYNNKINVKGRIIFNPLKPDLPKRFIGVRKKRIVNFCRISKEKNLHLLINSFDNFSKDFPEYELWIYGDAVGESSQRYIENVEETIKQVACKNKIHILPAQQEIHRLIRDYSMFVSSSDFEGMSNSMLEAMAIGLPTICTDCPAGGARAIIKDHENGILVPVNDVDALANAMKEVAGNPALAEKLSVNGTKIREELSVDKIVNQWMEIIND